MNELIHGLSDVWIDECMSCVINASMHDQLNAWMGKVVEWMTEWINKCMNWTHEILNAYNDWMYGSINQLVDLMIQILIDAWLHTWLYWVMNMCALCRLVAIQ